MNERIRELAEQAGSTHKQSLGVYQFYEHELEKFAELVVKECANIAHNKQYKHSPAHTVGDCATAIKQHFGVEE